MLFETLDRINNHHGRGTVIEVRMNVGDDNGIAIIEFGWVGKGQKPLREEKRFSIIGDRVRFRGVTRKIGYQIK